ncbi:hypothetical protein FJZ17_04495 [Candidatus Pacearchaeota archaeon]|nr:hypothetical protein [Candidatus Pacearchaeota archaeon]
MNDKTLIIQAMNGLNKIDEQISSILVAAGNTREIDLAFKKGEYIISPFRKELIFVLKGSGLKYSEPGQSAKQGEVSISTSERNKLYDIFLSLNYNSLNVTFNYGKENKTLSASPVGYKLVVENNGKINAPLDNSTNLNFKIV